jgi:hypothetical protein
LGETRRLFDPRSDTSKSLRRNSAAKLVAGDSERGRGDTGKTGGRLPVAEDSVEDWVGGNTFRVAEATLGLAATGESSGAMDACLVEQPVKSTATQTNEIHGTGWIPAPCGIRLGTSLNIKCDQAFF